VQYSDLLLLNASNILNIAVFPYAFVQVTSTARRFGVSVSRYDLVFDRRETWQRIVAELLSRHAPRMIGIHLRQVQSLMVHEYLTSGDHYRPIDTTRFLIQQIKELTPIPIVVGGFGFTSNALEIIKFLDADYGVLGDPDSFFENFENIIKGSNLENINNLIYKAGNEYLTTSRVLYQPSTVPEYDDELCSELRKFYKRAKKWPQRVLSARASYSVAVEVSRGCPFKCYFCSEPHVKGSTIRTRDLDVVFKDVEFLLERGFRWLWFVCSEANSSGPALLQEIAMRMIPLRKKYSWPRPPFWQTYLLPRRMSDDLIELLARSGHSWAWNEIQSANDDNLRATRVPYSVNVAVQFLKGVLVQSNKELAGALRAALKNGSPAFMRMQRAGWTFPKDLAVEEIVVLKVIAQCQILEKEYVLFRLLCTIASIPGLKFLRWPALADATLAISARFRLGTFIGNAYSIPETLRSTIQAFIEHGLHEEYYFSGSLNATAVLGHMDSSFKGLDKVLTPKQEFLDVSNLEPTFVVNGLRRAFANFDEFAKFNGFVCDTFLSRGHLLTKRWSRFLGQNTSPKSLAAWLETSLGQSAEVPYLRVDDPLLAFITKPLKKILQRPVDVTRIEPFIEVPDPARPRRTGLDPLREELVPFTLTEIIYSAHRHRLIPAFQYLNIPHDEVGAVHLTEYGLMELLYRRYNSTDELLGDVLSSVDLKPRSVDLFCLKKFLFHSGVVFREDYRKVLYGDAAGNENLQAIAIYDRTRSEESAPSTRVNVLDA
jgi:hypothetical protein